MFTEFLHFRGHPQTSPATLLTIQAWEFRVKCQCAEMESGHVIHGPTLPGELTLTPLHHTIVGFPPSPSLDRHCEHNTGYGHQYKNCIHSSNTHHMVPTPIPSIEPTTIQTYHSTQYPRQRELGYPDQHDSNKSELNNIMQSD
jgi:hypothetical protein